MRAWSFSLLLVAGCFADAPIVEADDAPDSSDETSTSGGPRGGESTSEQGASEAVGDVDEDSGDDDGGVATSDSGSDAMGDSDTSDTDSPDGPCNGLPCPVGCEAEVQGEHLYAVCGVGFANYTAWSVASDVCTELGGALVRIETAAENSAVKAAIANHLTGFETAWIGANDRAAETTWVWLDDAADDAFYIGGPGQQPVPPQEIVDWAGAEPNNDGPFAVEEDCGAVYSAGWLDLPCSNETPFVCEF